MVDSFLPEGIERPDFYIAAIGRSGSTMIGNWLSRPPSHLVFLEPFFLRAENSRLLRIQLRDFGMPASDEEWKQREESAAERFDRLMHKRLVGRRWAVKEVLVEEHFRAIDALAPRKILLTVRSIDDVALSLFEKHRAQENVDRFSDDWVIDYCVRESAGLVKYRKLLDDKSIPYMVVRYEDFTASSAHRSAVASFVGWPGEGATQAHFEEFDPSFEIERHGASISSNIRAPVDRNLSYEELRLAESLTKDCATYQAAFGYC